MNSCDVVEFEIEVIKPCLEKSLSALVLKKQQQITKHEFHAEQFFKMTQM